MARALERTIIKPTHAAYGLPTVTLAAGLGFALVMAAGYFIPGLAILGVGHLVSIFLRGRYPHGENLIWRHVSKRKGRYDWQGKRRVYHA